MPDYKHKLAVIPPRVCDVPDDSCVRVDEHQFLTGISVRHSPSCTGNFCGLFSCDGGNWRVTNEGTLDRSKWIEGWIITQLLTRGQVDCDEHPLGQRGGGWWADAFRTPGTFISGSKLWSLQWTHGGARNDLLLRAEDVARQALVYLYKWGIVSEITVKATYVAKGNIPLPGAIMHLRVSVKGPGIGFTMTLEGQQLPGADFLWKEYQAPKPMATGGRHYTHVEAFAR